MCITICTNVSVPTVCSTMTGFKTFICSCVYFHFHTDDGLSRNRNVCTYCYAHKIMKFITFALVFSFILSVYSDDCSYGLDLERKGQAHQKY